MSTVFACWPRLYLTPEDEPDEGGRVPLLVDLAHLHIVPPLAPMNVVSLTDAVAIDRLAYPDGDNPRHADDAALRRLTTPDDPTPNDDDQEIA